MPDWVLGKLDDALKMRHKELADSRILLLGLAYKPDVDDPRESPAFELLAGLLSRGAAVTYHDPHIPEAPRMRFWPELPALHSEPLTVATIEAADAVVVVTHHQAVDWKLVRSHAALIIDTRGVYRDYGPDLISA